MSPASGAMLLFPLLCLAVPAVCSAVWKKQPAWGAGLASLAIVAGFGLLYLTGRIDLSDAVEGLATGAAVFFAGVVPVVFGLFRTGDWKVISALSVWAGPQGVVWVLAAVVAVMGVAALMPARMARARTSGSGPYVLVGAGALVLAEVIRFAVTSSVAA